MTSPELRAGAGSDSIAFPPETWPLDGFGGQGDPLFVRTLLLELGGDRIAIVVLDLTSLAAEPLAAVRAILAAELDLSDDRLLIGVSHTFSAPHLTAAGDNDEHAALARDAVHAAVLGSARAARAALRPATMATAETTCHISVNRDIETEDGWALGRDENGFTDETLSVLHIKDVSGADIAVLANYAVQPSVKVELRDSAGLLVVSPDLAGAAMRQVETSLPGAVGFFLIGASGDQAPALVQLWDAASEILGARLGAAVVAATRDSTTASVSQLGVTAHSVVLPGQEAVDRLAFRPTRSHRYIAAPSRELPFWILVLGSVAIVAVQVELSAEWGARVRMASPFAVTLVVTMVNGGDKYLPDASSFDRMTYEALSSRYARGGAEVLEHAALHELRQLAARAN